LVVYGLAPWVGLYVLLDNPDRIEGQLLGLIGITMGSFALYLLFTRLRDPLGAIRYALRPLRVVSRLVEDWHSKTPQTERSARSLKGFLSERLPDVAIQERGSYGEQGEEIALAVGEELLVCLSPGPRTPEEVEGLIERLEELRTPLQEEPLILVLPEISELLKAQLISRLRRARLITPNPLGGGGACGR